jgi:aerobic-type carbon monoxide dehydrogenase small subunit (CoxS/CutS family)
VKLTLTVNGAARAVDVHGARRCSTSVREDLGLTGTKEGCGEGECGACTVLVDGPPRHELPRARSARSRARRC